MVCILPGSSVHGILQATNTGLGCHFLLQGDLPDPWIEPASSALQADPSPSESPGKPNYVPLDVKDFAYSTLITLWAELGL